ncbi:uncharacterized protein BT62DRAFT_935830 [Guyanagaster necrorhizus]|uniref:Uncharacterized protein n=1 Tax=Guyanagaster necrorhizus TaxID=856835 RepID=A0A9P8APA9_9AGAR|nr:uncharacterized protein BT62DRAFT_935830 [Guyanagaster necrorhizus MCA 3950]KAG7442789.1 hypothetical protein BT62DRAFT_935830 [Guyanagaster necrorhizus MCA 3950]
MYPGKSPAGLHLTNRRDMSRPREQNNGLSDSHSLRRRRSQSDLQDIQLTCFKRPLTIFPPPIQSCSRQFDMDINTASNVPGCRGHTMLFSSSGLKPVSVLGSEHTTSRILPPSLTQTESSQRYQSPSLRGCSFYIRPRQFSRLLTPLWLTTNTEDGIPHERR